MSFDHRIKFGPIVSSHHLVAHKNIIIIGMIKSRITIYDYVEKMIVKNLKENSYICADKVQHEIKGLAYSKFK